MDDGLHWLDHAAQGQDYGWQVFRDSIVLGRRRGALTRRRQPRDRSCDGGVDDDGRPN